MRKIIESDWKILRQFHPIGIERLCHRILQEIEHINTDNTKSFHQRYLDIYNIIKKRDKEIASIFDNLSRSNAFNQIAAMKHIGLFTEEEFSHFSEETRSVISVFLGE